MAVVTKLHGLPIEIVELMLRRKEVAVLDDGLQFYCKLCDEWFDSFKHESHVEYHQSAFEALKGERREARLEALAAGRETEPKSSVQKLWCVEGDHSWERPAQRGRAPKCCPKHKPVVEPKVPREPKVKSLPPALRFKAPKPMLTLFCEVGKHEWQREAQRGRKPKCCPNCKEV